MESLTLSSYLSEEFVRKKLLEIDRRVSSVLEASRIAYRNQLSPILFKNVDGKRYPLAMNTVFSRDVFRKELKAETDNDLYLKFLNALNKPVSLSEDSLENYYVEKNVSLSSLPILKFYPNDGGKYITSSIILAGDGEGNYNASIHRLMVIDDKRAAIRIVPRHLYRMFSKFKEKSKHLPIVVLVGTHPLITLCASFSPPYGVYEMEVANSLFGGSIKAAYIGETEIPTPLVSEFIFLGKLRYDIEVDEGPFVDILETYDIVRKQPIVEIEKIWVRDGGGVFQEILPGGIEHKLLMGFPREVMIWDSVRKVVPEVKAVRLTYGGGGWLHAVVSIKKQTEGDGKNAILAAFSGHPSLKHVVIVDDDINVDDINDVEWAIATRFRADRDLVIVENVRGSSLDPVSENSLTAKVGIDATKPLDKPQKLFEKAKL